MKSALFVFQSAPTGSCGKCHEKARGHFAAFAHGQALRARAANAPDCLACHRQAVVAVPPAKPTLAQKLAQTKQGESCPVGQARVAGQARRGTKFVRAFDRSVHGAALLGGNVEAANCVDCHGAHDIRKHTDPTWPSSAKNVAQQVCGNCPASLRRTQKYGLPSQSFQTFSDSFPGLAVRGGAGEIVNGTSRDRTHASPRPARSRRTIFESRRYGSRCTKVQRRARRRGA